MFSPCLLENDKIRLEEVGPKGINVTFLRVYSEMTQRLFLFFN